LEIEHRYYEGEFDTEATWRVIGTLTHRNVNLSSDALKKVPGLENLSRVFRGFKNATTSPVTPAEGAILLRLVEGA
jgi:hypothetical protein